MTPSLQVEGLSVSSREGPLVRSVSFSVQGGIATTLIGETGSGKSLIAQAIAGQLPRELAVSGSIWINGLDVISHPEVRRLREHRLAVLPQEPWLALDPTMRAGAQVFEVFHYVRSLASPSARRAASEMLASLSVAHAEMRYPFQLSGGMCQRVAIAMTRAADPDVLLVDEPTKGLDAALRDRVVVQLQEELAAGRALLTITHDIGVARALGGTIAVMLDGVIVEQGPSEQVLDAPRHDYTRRLVMADPACWPDQVGPVTGHRVVAGKGLVKKFGKQVLFDGFDIEIGAGETVALLGASGCGKTTIGNILLNLVWPDSGTLWRDSTIHPVRYQKIYQDPPAAFAPRQTVGAGLAHLARRMAVPRFQIDSLLEQLHLSSALLERTPGQLSGGELQRFAILRSLLVDPVFLFADEPTSRLDPLIQQDVMLLLRKIITEREIALLLVTHDHVLADKSARRIVPMPAKQEAMSDRVEFA